MVDVFPGPCGGCHLVGNSGILGGESKGVPAHGLQDVFALHALVPGYNVRNGVVAHVAHVKLAAGVGKHRQTVEFISRIILNSAVRLGFCPACLCLELNLLWGVFLVHTDSITWLWWP